MPLLPILAVFSLAAGAQAQPSSSLKIDLCNAGEHQQFETVTCDIQLSNKGDKPIHVVDALAFSHWDAIEKEVIVPAHGAAYLRATVGINDSVGFTHRYFQLTTDEPGEWSHRNAHVQVFSSTVLDQNAPVVDFGVVKLDEPSPVKSITLTSREVADFRILQVTAKPDFVDASIAEDGRTISVSVKKNAPWGPMHEKVQLKINAPQQPEAWIRLEGDIHGEIVPDANPVVLGMMRTNRRNEFLIRLTRRDGKDFKIGKTTLERVKGDAKHAACVPKTAGCQLVKVLIDNKKQAPGRVGGVLLVELPEFKQTLPIELAEGLLLPPKMHVLDMNKANEEARQKQGKLQSEISAPTQRSEVDVKQAIQKVVQRREEAPPGGNGPLLRWSVANQAFVYAYIIYRAEAEAGPALRVNKELIRVKNDGEKESGSYQWRDSSAEPGKTYWYSIGMVKEDGEKVQLSSPQKIVAK